MRSRPPSPPRSAPSESTRGGAAGGGGPVRRPRRRVLAALFGAALVLGGCDNPYCVFSESGCFGTGGTPGALGDQAASLPETGQVIRAGAPRVERVVPDVSGFSHPETPIAIVFSESMSAASLNGAIAIQPIDLAGFPGSALPASGTLVAEGRVLVLLPTVPSLPAGDYQISLAPGATPTDVTGQTLAATNDPLGFFSVDVAGNEPVTPKKLLSFPEGGDAFTSATGELVVIFDRDMQESSFDTASFAVTIDGSPPAFPSLATPLFVEVGVPPFVVTVPDARVWTWRLLDGAASRTALPAGAAIEVTLSDTMAQLLDVAGEPLPTDVFTYDVAPFSAPDSAFLMSSPADAIGIKNLDASDPLHDPLTLAVTMPDAFAGDQLTAYLFGRGLTDPAVLVAVARTIDLALPAPPPAPLAGEGAPEGDPLVTDATFTLADLDFLSSTDPLQAIFSDGDVAIALAVQRGAEVSPLFVLDVSAETGIQDALLDTVRPELFEVFGSDFASGGSGTAIDLRSDAPGATLAGRASEPLSAVRVEVTLPDASTLDNGAGKVVASSPVQSATQGSTFLARPVDVPFLVDLVGPVALAYQAELVDRAENATLAPVAGTLTLLGRNGIALGPDEDVLVHVYDAVTLEPIAGAQVISHADNGADYPQLGTPGVPADTDAAGNALVPGHATGQAGTIVTVSHPLYDLFTFHDVPFRRLDVALVPYGAASASTTGTVTATTNTATFGTLGRRIGDSRRGLVPFPTTACAGFPFSPICTYVPLVIDAGRLGGVGFVAGNLGFTNPDQATAGFLVRTFALDLPAGPVAAGDTEARSLQVSTFLGDPGVPEEDLPVALPDLVLSAAGITGIDLGALFDDPTYSGEPSVTVEATVPGMRGTLPVGIGLAFPDGALADTWDVRSAIPGAADAAGILIADGTIDAELRVRAEITDLAATVGLRRELSDLQAATEPVGVVLPSAGALLSPPDLGTTAPGFDLSVEGSLAPFVTDPLDPYTGLYRVVLADAAGRRWTLVRVAGAGDPVTLRAPDVLAAGGTPLMDGLIAAVAAPLAWRRATGLAAGFEWSELERDFDLYSFSTPSAFTLTTGP